MAATQRQPPQLEVQSLIGFNGATSRARAMAATRVDWRGLTARPSVPSFFIPQLTIQKPSPLPGNILNGLQWHPDGVHVLYPLGSSVVVKNLKSGNQTFLTGHTDVVTCVALSKDGKTVASGQRVDMGVKVRMMCVGPCRLRVDGEGGGGAAMGLSSRLCRARILACLAPRHTQHSPYAPTRLTSCRARPFLRW